MHISVLFENPAHLEELLRVEEITRIYLPLERLLSSEEAAGRRTAAAGRGRETTAPCREAVRRCQEAGKEAWLALPYLFRRETAAFLRQNREALAQARADGWLVRTLDEAGFLEAEKLPGRRIFDAGLYSWNREAALVLKGLGADQLTAPYELNARELADRGQEDTELVVYGRLPVMVSAQCPLQTETGRCGKGRQEYAFRPLRDRKGMAFLAENRCRFCYNVIYNSVPLWLWDKPEARWEWVRFHFTSEEEGEPRRILERCLRGSGEPPRQYTRGHFTRGVE